MRRARGGVVGGLVALVTACPAQPGQKSAPVGPYAVVDRASFNSRAALEALPLFWREDLNRNKSLDANELSVLWHPSASTRADWVVNGEFTDRFRSMYKRLSSDTDPPSERLQLVHQELRSFAPTLVFHDLSRLCPAEQTFVQQVAELAHIVERLYQRQLGSAQYLSLMPTLDPVSRALFIRKSRAVVPIREVRERSEVQRTE